MHVPKEIEFWRRRLNRARDDMSEVVMVLGEDVTLNQLTSSIVKVALSVQTVATVLEEILESSTSK
ncbi:MAG TPA: hypothetical protein ENF41_00670 [Candidatus Bathyarchaeota archaeon]|nr:hypothetical protein [Candidatus Bathyarchaeota archaeon]